MGIKRSAKKGDYKRAVTELQARSGVVEGTPNSILNSLGFDGSWNEFKAGIKASVVKTDIGRYAVLLSEAQEMPHVEPQFVSAVDPRIFAMCVSAFILGEGETEDFENFTGKYEHLDDVVVWLANEVDSSIGGLYLPFKTDEDVEIYAVERSLLYTASGDGLFTLYGSAVLANAQTQTINELFVIIQSVTEDSSGETLISYRGDIYQYIVYEH